MMLIFPFILRELTGGGCALEFHLSVPAWSLTEGGRGPKGGLHAAWLRAVAMGIHSKGPISMSWESNNE
jgi:hypothetical protein